LRLPFRVSFAANASTMLSSGLVVSGLSQLDATLQKPLIGGMTIALREHVALLPTGARPLGMNGVYLELRAPLDLPTVPKRTPGRVDGRVVDAATGRGLSNVLVRVGKEAVITDADGRAALSGLSAGKYSVSVESADRAHGAVTVGDATVEVGSKPGTAATFAAALAVGARVRATVRRAAFASGAATGDRDSLVDDGGMDNVVVALMGARDTIYQASGPDGVVDFGVVAPGEWSAAVANQDVPAFHAFDQTRIAFTVSGGDRRDLAFRLVPKHRAVTLLGASEPEVLSAPTTGTATSVARDTIATHAPTPRGHRLRGSPHVLARVAARTTRAVSAPVVEPQGAPRVLPRKAPAVAPGRGHGATLVLLLSSWLLLVLALLIVLHRRRRRDDA
jgi:hypothetical protein